MSLGELYKVVNNKKAKGKAGAIVAIVQGTKADNIIIHLNKIPLAKRRQLKQITLDMAPNMQFIARTSFTRATQVTDRFHVQKLASEALQEIRIKYRWIAIDQKNEAILTAKSKHKEYSPGLLLTGETRKQLLARSQYLLYKSQEKWT